MPAVPARSSTAGCTTLGSGGLVPAGTLPVLPCAGVPSSFLVAGALAAGVPCYSACHGRHCDAALCRGCTCVEQSVLGGVAHLLNFDGTGEGQAKEGIHRRGVLKVVAPFAAAKKGLL